VKVKPSKPDPNLFLPDTFSFTQISEFRKCPMRYKYRHLLHLPLPGNQHLSFGNTIHSTLEKFLNKYKTSLEMTQGDLFAPQKKKGDLPTLHDLLELYEHNWVDEWYQSKKQKEQYRERGKQMLKDFYEKFAQEPVAPKFLEKSFRLKISDYFFLGKIDRADVDKDGALKIIDYKTGETKLDKGKEDKYQLLTYQWAAQEYLKEKVNSLSYWYLVDNSESEPFLGTEQDISELKNMILETIEEIRGAVQNNNFKELDQRIKHDCDFEDFD
ncbi:MAG TPA: PD-(D/E)XK nuclease family protein, partial [Patescibacteria group bacterium]